MSHVYSVMSISPTICIAPVCWKIVPIRKLSIACYPFSSGQVEYDVVSNDGCIEIVWSFRSASKSNGNAWEAYVHMLKASACFCIQILWRQNDYLQNL